MVGILVQWYLSNTRDQHLLVAISYTNHCVYVSHVACTLPMVVVLWLHPVWLPVCFNPHQMSLKFKLAARIRRFLLKRPSTKKEETNHFNLTDKHDDSNFPLILTPAHANSTVFQSDSPPAISAGISSPEDSIHHADVSRKYETFCSSPA